MTNPADHGITADTPTSQLEWMATRPPAGDAEPTISLDELLALRERARDAVRDQLDQLADQIALAEQRRRDLICQVHRWGTDTHETIGRLAGMTPAEVATIAAASEYVI